MWSLWVNSWWQWGGRTLFTGRDLQQIQVHGGGCHLLQLFRWCEERKDRKEDPAQNCRRLQERVEKLIKCSSREWKVCEKCVPFQVIYNKCSVWGVTVATWKLGQFETEVDFWVHSEIMHVQLGWTGTQGVIKKKQNCSLTWSGPDLDSLEGDGCQIQINFSHTFDHI